MDLTIDNYETDDENSTRCELSILIEASRFCEATAVLNEHPEQATTADSEGWTPLHFACMNDVPDIDKNFIRALIDKSDIKRKDLSGLNAFHYLCENILTKPSMQLRVELIEIFLRKHPELARIPSDDGMYPLHMFLATGSLSLLPLPSDETVQQCYQIILQAYPQAVSKRCESKMYPLHYACRYMIPALAPNVQYDKFLLDTIPELIRLYPKSLSKKDDSWRYPIHHLCKHLSPNCLSAKQLYLAVLEPFPISVGKKNRWGLNPLHEFWSHGETDLSSKESFLDIADILMKCSIYGAIDIPKNEKWLPLHAAINLGCPLSVLARVMPKYSDYFCTRDNEGNTPLMKSILRKNILYDEDFEDVNQQIDDIKCSDNVIGHEDDEEITIPLNATMLLASSYPQAVNLSNNRNQFPIHTAMNEKLEWDLGLKLIIDAEPTLLTVCDSETRLYPFMTAAKNSMLDECFRILVSRPEVIQHLLDLPMRSFVDKDESISMSEERGLKRSRLL